MDSAKIPVTHFVGLAYSRYLYTCVVPNGNPRTDPSVSIVLFRFEVPPRWSHNLR